MVCNGLQEIKEFMAKIQEGELFDTLDQNCASFKKFDEVNNLKEQSRQRKMQTLYRQQMQKEKAVRRSLRRDEPNSATIESPDIDPENARLEQGRLERERRVANRLNRNGENEGSSTISGRQKNRPKYLNDYDQQNKNSDDDDDAFEEDEYDDEDENADDSDEEEYIHGRSKLAKRGRGGAKPPRQRGGRSRSGRSSRIVEEPMSHKRQK